MLPGAQPIGRVDVTVEGLRSNEGQLRICLTADPENFPDCIEDRAAITRSAPASERTIAFAAVPSGDYGIAIIHDENGNARLDTFAGIPREGIAFSRNPRVRFGAPSFADVAFPVAQDSSAQTVRMRYFL